MQRELFLLELIGVKVFKKQTKKGRKNNTLSLKSDPHTPESVTQGSQFELPELDATLGPCAFAKEAIRKLLATGYIFTDSQMELYSSVESSREYTRRNLPLFWILKEGESRKTCDKSIRERYWAEEFTSGHYRFLAFSQWYDDSKKGATKENFLMWYNSL